MLIGTDVSRLTTGRETVIPAGVGDAVGTGLDVAVGATVGVGVAAPAAVNASPRLTAPAGSWSDMAPTSVLAPVAMSTVKRSEPISERKSCPDCAEYPIAKDSPDALPIGVITCVSTSMLSNRAVPLPEE